MSAFGATIHWGQVALATMLGFVFSGIWYGPLFGQTFVDLAFPRISLAKLRENSPAWGLAYAVFGFIVTFSLQNALFNAVKITDAWEGAVVGLGVALVGAGLQLAHHIFEMRPMGIFWMHQVNHAIVCAAVGVLYAVMAR